MTKLEEAILLAHNKHIGQVDPNGDPIFLHVYRVMVAVGKDLPIPKGEDLGVMQIAAVLHDIVEDTNLTEINLQDMFGAEVAALVGILTRRPNEKYIDDYIHRVRIHYGAGYLKILDIRDNLRLERVNRLPEEKRISLSKRYHEALKILGAEE